MIREGWVFCGATLVPLATQLFDDAWKRWAVDAPEHEVLPNRRGIQWGAIYSPRHSYTYFRIRLFSWKFMECDYGRNWGLYQRELVWTSLRGWFVHYRLVEW